MIRTHLGAPFDEREVDLIALLARYHRRTPPKLKHRRYAALDEPGRRLVCWLGGILRVADGPRPLARARRSARSRRCRSRAASRSWPRAPGPRTCAARCASATCSSASLGHGGRRARGLIARAGVSERVRLDFGPRADPTELRAYQRLASQAFPVSPSNEPEADRLIEGPDRDVAALGPAFRRPAPLERRRVLTG